MRQRVAAVTIGLAPLLAFFACQGYDFIFQPDTDRQGAHLRFTVEQPSKADILFVIDNSISMSEEQAALAASVDVLLTALAPQDTRYRIGITSTDAIGYETNCAGEEEEYIRQDYPGAKSDCTRLELDPSEPEPELFVRRPHDGALGRLIAAYDKRIFDLDHPQHTLTDDLDPSLKPILARVLPTGPYTHPADAGEYDFEDFAGFKGEAGARWVIDRETIRLEACQACQCTQGDGSSLECDEEADCYAQCVVPMAPKLVEAYFRANLAGLGIGGQGWEEGLKSAAYAVGIDPEAADDEAALNPENNLTRVPGGPNTFLAKVAAGGLPGQAPWMRDEALLAVMFVTDEEDCSMPETIWANHCAFERGCSGGWVEPPDWQSHPEGSLCYQSEVQPQLLSAAEIARLLVRKKGDSVSRVAVGFIGGVTQVGEHRTGQATDCAVQGGVPTSECSCLNAPWVMPEQMDDCQGWCAFTQDDNGMCDVTPPTNPPYCDALAGSRYLSFTNAFRRRTFESICRAEAGLGFGDAMARFAQIATLACFELDGIAPAGTPPNPDYIQVTRASKAEAELGIPPTLLPRRSRDSLEEGWYFDTEDDVPRICLTGLDRLIGDVYDIFMLTRDHLDFTR